MQEIARKTEFTSHKYIYHVAGFLADDISEKGFMKQPWQGNPRKIKAEILLLKGVKAELAGNKAEAKQHYQAYQDQPAPAKPLDPNRDTYLSWRISQL